MPDRAGLQRGGEREGVARHRAAPAEDRPALFAADFALSHACWLLCYSLAGWLAARRA